MTTLSGDEPLPAPDLANASASMVSADTVEAVAQMFPLARFDREDVRGAVVVGVAGELDLATEEQFDQVLDDALHDTTGVLVVDLHRVEFMGSAGAAALLRLHLQAQRRGIEARVVSSSSPGPRRSLELLGLHRYLTVYADRAEALPPPSTP